MIDADGARWIFITNNYYNSSLEHTYSVAISATFSFLLAAEQLFSSIYKPGEYIHTLFRYKIHCAAVCLFLAIQEATGENHSMNLKLLPDDSKRARTTTSTIPPPTHDKISSPYSTLITIFYFCANNNRLFLTSIFDTLQSAHTDDSLYTTRTWLL